MLAGGDAGARAADARHASRPTSSAIAAALSPRTRAIVINSPHNPSGTVLVEGRHGAAGGAAAADRRASSSATRSTSTWCSTGEHQSVARFPELAARSVVVSSFGKTYHVTGWKVGYAAAPAALSAEFRKVHQFNVFTVNTPMQHGLAAFMADPSHHLGPARLLPAQARPVPRRAGEDAAARPALPGHLLPVRRLLGRQRQARGRLLPLADDRDRRRRDPALGVLRRRLRAAHRPLLLRQEGRDAGPGDRAPGRALSRGRRRLRRRRAGRKAWAGRAGRSSPRLPATARRRGRPRRPTRAAHWRERPTGGASSSGRNRSIEPKSVSTFSRGLARDRVEEQQLAVGGEVEGLLGRLAPEQQVVERLHRRERRRPERLQHRHRLRIVLEAAAAVQVHVPVGRVGVEALVEASRAGCRRRRGRRGAGGSRAAADTAAGSCRCRRCRPRAATSPPRPGRGRRRTRPAARGRSALPW